MQTQEALTWLGDLRAALCRPCGSALSRERKAFIEAVDVALAALSRDRWISVEWRLPEPGERVLVTNGGFVCESYRLQSGEWMRGGVGMFFMTPTHWRPLPEPPKEET